MSEQKPNVFPTKEEVEAANRAAAENLPKPDIDGVSDAEKQAAIQMYEKNLQTLKERESNLKSAIDSNDKTEAYRAERMAVAEEEKAIRDARMDLGKQQHQPPIQVPPTTPPTTPPTSYLGQSDDSGNLPEGFVKEIMEPQWDAPYDLIPLPSAGKLYKGVEPKIRLAFLNASDENLLTSPHILESDQFLEILINRKILEPNLRYRDLHIGDRNAIMIWLRATAYGSSYPISLLDNNGEVFEYDFDLAELKSKELGAEPDTNGNFSFTLPTNNNVIRFKLLTTSQIDSLEKLLEYEKSVLKTPINNTITYTLQNHIVDINGEGDEAKIKSSIDYMRSSDRKILMDYIESIESGLDLEITVPTPSGESVTTFLPLNFNFFWPNSRI